jgi:FkbM family methyltransferase
MAWQFQLPSAVSRLRDKARYGLAGAATAPNTADDLRVVIDTHVIDRSSSLNDFFQAYFGSPQEKCLIQVGANDGVMCDPLRRFLVNSKNQNISAVLVEPIPFYYEKLCDLYRDYPEITVLNAACGPSHGRAPLYFIDPSVADQMNGDGPANNWAHGQGSFDPNIVKYWIERNRFRGEDYVRNIDTYLQSIISIDVEIVPLSDVAMSRQNDNLLIVIDVQGSELEVIRGIDWNYPPAFIVLEDDLNKSGPISEYLASRGYFYLCGRHDKLYVRGSRIGTRSA